MNSDLFRRRRSGEKTEKYSIGSHVKGASCVVFQTALMLNECPHVC